MKSKPGNSSRAGHRIEAETQGRTGRGRGLRPRKNLSVERGGASGRAWASAGGCASEEGLDSAAGSEEGGGGGGSIAQYIQFSEAEAWSLRGPNVGVSSGAGNHPVGVTKPLAGSAMPPAR